MKQVKRKLAGASMQKPCDTLLINGKIIDVYTCSIYEASVAITDGEIIGIGDYTEANEIIDIKGKYISPALIDGHVHIESAMVRPEDFASVLLPKGVTTVIADPHELANVAGAEAVEYMLRASTNLPLDVKMMVPSSVPAASFEENGSVLTSSDAERLFRDGGAYGLGEVMDFPAVLNGDEEMLKKIELANTFGAAVDGHAAGLNEAALNAYRVAGIENDHEAVTAEEALARVQRGFYVLMREGTAARDVEALLPAVTSANARRFAFATDDKHLDDLIEEGSVDFNVRKAIKLGMNPLQAIQIGSLNAAECFKLDKKGAVAPGKEATFLLVSDLDAFQVDAVYVNGQLVAEQGKLVEPIREPIPVPEKLLESMHVAPFTIEDLSLRLTNSEATPVIKAKLGSIVTEKLVERVEATNGVFQPGSGHLKLVVVERHHATGHIGLGIVKGLAFSEGAIVATVAHDSHNIIACGADDRSLYHAIHHVAEIGGGMAIVKGDQVLASMPLQLGGLMSIEPVPIVKKQLNELQKALLEIGYNEKVDPFLTLAFLALPVIPSIKLTSKGLFDVNSFSFLTQ
ncbi:adenine deaminase [Shouchella patagoniensis]|uniref:adenine deaminase n=1 Tax=Shouchella patagoniensis TaxID=228576 RepID=UPI000994A710|nr:adenine deaminase [Shouchella patagoniensis]